MEKNQRFYFHHSSHGQTTLNKLLVDRDRREKIILTKYGIPEISKSRSFFDLSYKKIYEIAESRIGKKNIQELFLKHKEEMDKIPLVDYIEGVPYGKKIEITYKVRGLQGHSVLAGEFSSDPEDVERFPHEIYHNYLKIYAIGDERNLGLVHKVELYLKKKVKVFFDLDENIALNVPNILHDYVADFKVGFFELTKEKGSKYFMVKTDDDDEPIKYAGASFNIKENAYMHSFSPDSKSLSAINVLINGTGNVDWDPEIYQRYFGFKNKIKPETEKIFLTIFGSHCLNLQEFEEYGDIGNVIPFMLDSCPEWYEIFKDDLYLAAEEEIEFQNQNLLEVAGILEGLIDSYEKSVVEKQDAVLDMTRLLRNNSNQYLLRPRSNSYHSSDLDDLNEEEEYYIDVIKDNRDKLREYQKKLVKAKQVFEALKFNKRKGLGPLVSTKGR